MSPGVEPSRFRTVVHSHGSHGRLRSTFTTDPRMDVEWMIIG
jgi:hypothetical protein